MSKPHIGITTGYKDGAQSVDHAYIHAIEQAGGIPIIVPMLTIDETARTFAELLDGLVITGGPGITRGLLGDLPEDLPAVDALRDTADTLIFHATQKQPVLGICYGMQFINAMHGGTIYADLAQQMSNVHVHSPRRGADPHPIHIDAQSHLGQILMQDTLTVNTYHIQAVAEVGQGLKISARSDDGVIESIESDDVRMLGVQFHPERMGASMMPLFIDFITRCQTYRENK